MRWWTRRTERDFAEEIEAHLALERDQQLAEGRTADEAQHAARRAFGNVTAVQERWTESRRGAWLEAGWRTLRLAARALVRRPGYTATAVITLAFGIGVNSALFTVLYSFLLRPLPVRDASHVVAVTRSVEGRYGLKVYRERIASLVSRLPPAARGIADAVAGCRLPSRVADASRRRPGERPLGAARELQLLPHVAGDDAPRASAVARRLRGRRRRRRGRPLLRCVAATLRG